MSAKKSSSVDLSYLGDKKLEKGKKQVLDETQNSWKGPSNKERKEEQVESKRLSKKIAGIRHRDTEKTSWRKRAFGIAIVFFLCGSGLFGFVSTIMGFIAGTGVVPIDIEDTAKVKEVLFGGDPWLVYCFNNETAMQRLPKVLEDHSHDLRSSTGLRVATMACWDRTSSGRSIVQPNLAAGISGRFKLRANPPLAFVVANGDAPRIINLQGLTKPEDIERKAKPALEVKTHKIDALKKWSSLCTSRRTCVVVGHKQKAQLDTALNFLKPLLDSNRAVKVVTLDTSFWQLKLDERLLAKRPQKAGGGRADIFCITRGEGGGKNATHSAAFLEDHSASGAGYFLQGCAARNDGLLVELAAAPVIKARPTKPKVVTPDPIRPKSQPSPAPKPKKSPNIDRVGSRADLERDDEVLFEAVDEEEQPSASEEDDGTEGDLESDADPEVPEDEDEDDGSEQVEL